MLARLWRWLTHDRQHRELLQWRAMEIDRTLHRDLQNRRDLTLLEVELNLFLAARRDASND